jgi:hypothetical protein
MGVRRIIAVGVTGVALIATSLMVSTGAAVATSATTPKPSSCPTIGGKDDPWPSWTQGRPKGIDPHTTAAIYMWHDNGWHIRVTHRTTNRRTFAGQLTTSGTFTGVKPVQLEKSDTFSVSSDKHMITFSFKNYGFIDGLDFFTHCAPSITFNYQSDGVGSPPSKIVIGGNAVHPPTDPFLISRNSTGPTAAAV